MIRWPFCLRSTLEAERRRATLAEEDARTLSHAWGVAESELTLIKIARSEATRKGNETRKAKRLANDPIVKEASR